MGRDIRGMKNIRDPDETILQTEVERAIYPFTKKPGDIRELRNELQNAMWDDVGVMRTAVGINRGVRRIAEIGSELMSIGVSGGNRAFNLSWHDWLNLRSLCDISEVIAKAGLERENSRGAHFREDFPDSGDLDSSYFTLARKRGDALQVSREPVRFTIVRPGHSILSTEEPDTLVGAAE